VVALAVISWWQLSSPRTQFTREHYDRIRLEMAPDEVALSVGSAPFDRMSCGTWNTVASESNVHFPLSVDKREVWADESVFISVAYSHGKAILKKMAIREPSWKVKAREWLSWLRGRVAS
jgi:hypothetical protein